MNSPPPTLEEATLMDLQDLEHNTRDRVHRASLASARAVLVVGFGGMRDRDGVIGFMPRSPRDISRLRFCIAARQRRLRVEGRTPASPTFCSTVDH
jgi:alpha,alpha-trehalose phosphorylase